MPTATKTPLHSLALAEDTIEMLRKHNLHTLEDLLAETEFSVCCALVEDDLGFGMSNELVSRAVSLFFELREITDELCMSFAGDRHTSNELWLMF